MLSELTVISDIRKYIYIRMHGRTRLSLKGLYLKFSKYNPRPYGSTGLRTSDSIAPISLGLNFEHLMNSPLKNRLQQKYCLLAPYYSRYRVCIKNCFFLYILKYVLDSGPVEIRKKRRGLKPLVELRLSLRHLPRLVMTAEALGPLKGLCIAKKDLFF